jgi:hypothetical protein
MGIQINGQTDTISAADGGLVVSGYDLDNPANLVVSGIITATTFSGNIIGTTATFSGNVSVGGTITYEDVTNVDSIGIVTARSGIVLTGGDVTLGTGVTVSGASANTFTLSTNGSERLNIDSSGNVNIDSGGVFYDNANNRLGIGTTTVDFSQFGSNTGGVAIADVGATNTGLKISDGSYHNYLVQAGNGNFYISHYGAGDTVFSNGTSGEEVFRVDASRRLLVGTSTVSAVSTAVFQGNSSSSTGNCVLRLQRGDAAPPTNNALAGIYFADNTATYSSAIIAVRDGGTWTANTSLPTRLEFYTTADGASSPTERMRINSNGSIDITQSNTNVVNLFAYSSNASFASSMLNLRAVRGANAAYTFLVCSSANAADTEFNLRGDGNAFADGTWSGGGADYAEYFEWSDGNPDDEDRRGISVVLDENQIRPAVTGEDPIGVISGNPSIVGDAAWNKWNGKYLRDEFGTYIFEDYEVTDDDGNTVTQQRRKLNPAYDSEMEYISREDRPEWDCVGLMGKLRIRKGQPTGSRWIKMRDINDSVEEWLVR